MKYLLMLMFVFVSSITFAAPNPQLRPTRPDGTVDRSKIYLEVQPDGKIIQKSPDGRRRMDLQSYKLIDGKMCYLRSDGTVDRSKPCIIVGKEK